LFGGYGLARAALALVVFVAIECPLKVRKKLVKKKKVGQEKLGKMAAKIRYLFDVFRFG